MKLNKIGITIYSLFSKNKLTIIKNDSLIRVVLKTNVHHHQEDHFVNKSMFTYVSNDFLTDR